jgi:hypothetical protein
LRQPPAPVVGNDLLEQRHQRAGAPALLNSPAYWTRAITLQAHLTETGESVS